MGLASLCLVFANARVHVLACARPKAFPPADRHAAMNACSYNGDGPGESGKPPAPKPMLLYG